MEGCATNTANGNTNTTNGHTPISLPLWIRSESNSSREEYVKKAVNVSRRLTAHLLRLVSSAEIMLSDITVEKVILLATQPQTVNWLTGSVMDSWTGSFVIQDVQFAMSSRGKWSPVSPCAVCAALGNILLEIFSRGRSSELINASRRGKSNTHLGDCINSNNNEAQQQATGSIPPAQKRRLTVAETAIYAKANGLLTSMNMPLSVCQLVSDLFDSINEPCPGTAVTSPEEALWDLTQMENSPELFLYDCICPVKALADTCLFVNTIGTDGPLFGREEELDILMGAKERVARHHKDGNDASVNSDNDNNNDSSIRGGGSNNLLCEVIFLSGYAGSGKSCLMRSLSRACSQEDWFVLSCKFDKQATPHVVVMHAFDDFFGKWGLANDNNNDDGVDGSDNLVCPKMMQAFHKACCLIFSAVDTEGFHQLCDLVPNFAKIFPDGVARSANQDHRGVLSMDKVGSARKRNMMLTHVIIKSLISVKPVLFAFDDLQWSSSYAMDGAIDFLHNYMQHDAPGMGLFIAGAFRSNEVDQDDDLFQKMNVLHQSKKAKVTKLMVGNFTQVDITKLISAKLCLPWRHTQGLAQLVHGKTRGNPFFIVQFLRSIVQNKMLTFSVKSRRWIWDCDVVDMQMISDEVAELLTTTFSQLPCAMMMTLKIVSCLGSQVEESTIAAMNARNGVLPFEMLDQLQLAVKEGILEKAGPVFQFKHDLIQQTVYELIPPASRSLLHKTIGKNLLQAAGDDPTIHLLGVDQINIFCKDCSSGLDPEERQQFAASNAVGAKFAIAASSFEQARSYTDAGMRLLETEHWERQYSLSLDLFYMASSVCCIDGDTEEMASCLSEILSHAKSFEDSLKASSLLAKLLLSSLRHEEAISNCLTILSKLGEEFPTNIDLPLILTDLSDTKPFLSITHDQIKQLPPMVNKRILSVMKFLNMLCLCSIGTKPKLVPLAACRMLKLTMQHGFCNDSIVGLFSVGYSLYIFTDALQLGYSVGKMCQTLIDQNPNRNALRARLCLESDIILAIDPFHACLSIYPSLYESAMLAGDWQSALQCFRTYIIGSVFTGLSDLVTLSKHFERCLQETIKYKQLHSLYITTTYFNTCLYLSGGINTEVDLKSYDELNILGERASNNFLLFQIFMSQMTKHFWMREYAELAQLCEKFPSSQSKRMLDIIRVFYEGVASLNLARDKKQAKWRTKWGSLGEKALATMVRFEKMSKWNYENKSKLLHAELHYLDGDLKSAEIAYEASILSAHKHKLVNEEAMAMELYGMFCVENNMATKGLLQLRNAVIKYRKWGATMKADTVKDFIDMVEEESASIDSKYV